MTLKKIFMLGSVLAGAAYLQNKGRRDRLFGQARGMLDKAKTRATELAKQAESATGASIADTGKSHSKSPSVGYGGSGLGGSGIGGSGNFR